MSSRTTNLNLYKPDRTEYVSVITDLNNNWDIIDQSITDNSNGITALSGEVTQKFNNLFEDIKDKFTVENGTTHNCVIDGNAAVSRAYRYGNIIIILVGVSVKSITNGIFDLSVKLTPTDTTLLPNVTTSFPGIFRANFHCNTYIAKPSNQSQYLTVSCTGWTSDTTASVGMEFIYACAGQ